MSDRHVPDNLGNKAFDDKNIDTLKNFAELVQAIGVLADAAKGIKTVLIYLGGVFGVWAVFNSEVLAWLKSQFI